MKKKCSRWILLFLIFTSFFCCSGCKKEITKHGFYFDTYIQITLYDDKYASLLEDCFQMAAEFEQMLSRHIEGSDIYRLNHAKGEPVTVSSDTLSLLTVALSYSELSNGSFDVTIGELVDLWNIKNNTGTVPKQADIDAVCVGIGYQNISISGNEVSLKNPGTQLDLGAIAKGYIADCMKKYLNENGVTEGIINLGGNVLVLGPKKDGSPYTIGIQKPFSPEGTPMFRISISDGTVVSSGIYERFFEADNTLYHHILNPKTGYPYDNQLLSVTIICPASVDGDALSTTCFSLGLEEGMKLIEKTPDTEAIFITKDYDYVVSSGMGTTIPYSRLE